MGGAEQGVVTPAVIAAVEQAGRTHFSRRGLRFSIATERTDGRPGLELTWRRSVLEDEGGTVHGSSYRYSVDDRAIADLVGADGDVAAGAVRYWLEGLLLEASAGPAVRPAVARASQRVALAA